MNKTRGFTIIEAIVVVSIFNVLMFALIAMLLNIFQAPKAETAAINQIDQARAVSNKFITEIRSAISCAGGASPIESATDNQVIFCIDSRRLDINPQLDIDKIRYYVTGSVLYKGVTSPSFNGSGYVYTSAEQIKAVLSNLDTISNDPIFYYYSNTYDGSGNPMPQPITAMASVQFIKISLPIVKQKLNPASSEEKLAGWSYRKKITIDTANVDTDLTYFPLYVKIANDAEIGSSAQSDGDDIRFTLADGTTLLDYEKESWVGGGGNPVTANFWVKVPVISGSTDTDIYVYYGNIDAEDDQDAINVWNGNFASVWHLKETGSATVGDYKDSTNNANNSTSTISQPVVTSSGKIAMAENFSSQYILVPHSNSIATSNVSVSLWVKTSDLVGDRVMLSKGTGANRSYWFYENNGLRFYMRNASSSNIPEGSIANNNWHYVVGTFDGTNLRIYLDGVAQGSPLSASSVSDSGENSGINAYGNGSYSGGVKVLDEVRISNTARSAQWIKFEYYNMNEADAELNFSTEETVEAGSFIEQAMKNTFTITAGATIRSLRSANGLGQ